MNNEAPRRHRFAYFEHLSIQEKINFARHLAIVVKAGLPLFDGLRIIRQQISSRTIAEVVDLMIGDINKGKTLADSLEAHRHLFGDFFINIIRVGEASGTLAQNLLYLADELKKSKELQRRVRSAMIYPATILFATITITAFLTFFVFPKILPVFEGLNIELPATTRFLIHFVQLAQSYGIQALLGIAALLVLSRFLLKSAFFRYAFDRTIFVLPVVGELMRFVAMANFTRVLGLLLKSGVRIVEAVMITGDTFENTVYRRAFAHATEEIRRGTQLADYLATQDRFFPKLLTGMIRIGENTGNLEENLFYLSEYYAEEVENQLKNLTTLLEPLMLLLMGFMVGFVAISIITPIYSLSQGVR